MSLYPKNCPHCGTAWEEEENIYEYFLKKYGDKEKADESARMYGCTPETPKYFGKDIMGIETSKYDGVSYWRCEKCKTHFDRWTMEEVDADRII